MSRPFVPHRASSEDHGHRGAELMNGFSIWTPAAGRQAQYQVAGSEYSNILEIEVPPNQTVTAEPGTMLSMSPGMSLGADVGSMGQGCKRCCCAGESLFRLHLENRTDAPQKVALTPSFPAKIVPIDLQEHSGLVFNRGAFLAAVGTDWTVDIRRTSSAGVCCFGGQGLFMNCLHGSGLAFLNAGGTVMRKELADGEEVVVDHHSVLAFERTVTLGIRRAGGFMVCCCAGQGLFNAVLTGPGWVMLHTMSLGKLRRAIGAGGGGAPAANAGGGS